MRFSCSLYGHYVIMLSTYMMSGRTAGEVPWTASDMQRLELLLGRNRDGHGAYAHVYEEDERYNFSERPLHSWADCY